MQHANAKLLSNYWQNLRGRAIAPMQKDIRPADIKSLLPNLIVLQKFDADHFVFRLAGTGYCAMFGREFRMQNMLSITEGPSRRYLSILLDRVLDVPCVGLISARAETLSGQHAILEYMLLPLADPDGRINRVLGTANITDWASASVYDRFARQTLLSMQVKDPADLPAPTPMKIADPIPTIRRKSRLELVRSNDTL